MQEFFESGVYAWAVLPTLIFLTRIVDVSMGTLRIIFINRNFKYWAAIIGFFEVLIWLLVIREIFNRLDNPLCFVAYAAGFATGNYVGIFIENKLSIGKVLIRIITRREADDLVSFMKASGFGLTVVDAQGATGPVKVIFAIVDRKEIETISDKIKQYNPNAFYSIEDVRFVRETAAPQRSMAPRKWNHFYSRMRKKV